MRSSCEEHPKPTNKDDNSFCAGRAGALLIVAAVLSGLHLYSGRAWCLEAKRLLRVAQWSAASSGGSVAWCPLSAAPGHQKHRVNLPCDTQKQLMSHFGHNYTTFSSLVATFFGFVYIFNIIYQNKIQEGSYNEHNVMHLFKVNLRLWKHVTTASFRVSERGLLTEPTDRKATTPLLLVLSSFVLLVWSFSSGPSRLVLLVWSSVSSGPSRLVLCLIWSSFSWSSCHHGNPGVFHIVVSHGEFHAGYRNTKTATESVKWTNVQYEWD